jgi:heptosyltransferase II
MNRRRVPAPPGGFRRIAVIRLSSLGDVVLTLPVVHALADAYPEAKISFWVKEEFEDVVRFDPRIAHVRVLERDARRLEDLVSMSAELEDVDLIVDLHGNARSAVLTWRQRAPVLRAPKYRLRRTRWVHARWTRPRPVPRALDRYAAALEPLGIAVECDPQVTAGESAERWADEWLAAWQPGTGREGRAEASWWRHRPPIALCPGAHHSTKRWPEANWLALHHELLDRGQTLVYVVTPAERVSFPELADRAARDDRSRWLEATIPQVAALFSQCGAAVSSDSGLMHLAAARGCRVIALFGSTSPVLGFAPAGPGHTVLCRNEPCQPCTLHGRAECPKKHFRCMRLLTPEPVLAALASIGTRTGS